MIRRPTARRPGATLLEVLIGFGILGVAVTSVITLFPYSALTLADAMKSDRTTTAAVSADAVLRDEHKRYVVEMGEAKTQEQYHWLMDNPNSLLPAPGRTVPAGFYGSTEPSFPVYLDPMGVVAGRGDVGGAGMIPRTILRSITEQPAAYQQKLALRFCSLMDGLKYNEDGTVPGSPTYDMRDMRYNFAWMLQRPSNRDRYTVRQQVVVYDRRTHLHAPPESEVACIGTLTPGETFVTLANVPATTELRKGHWILDAGNNALGLRHAEFYRIVSATDTGNGTYTLEVHKPAVRLDDGAATFGAARGPFNAVVVIIPAVADVFERPLLTAGLGP